MDCFFYGTLCHDALRRAVLGAELAAVPATLSDHAVFRADGSALPVLVAQAGATTQGVLLRGLTAQDMARLDHYMRGFGCARRDMIVQVADQRLPAQVYCADEAGVPGEAWDLTDWQRRLGAAAVSVAGDVMRRFGTTEPSGVAHRYDQLLVRGASRVRAAVPGPVTLRFAADPGDVDVSALRQPYARFFAVEEYDLAFRRFDRTMSPVVTRAVFVSGDAVTVLPYDPERDRVLVIEQFRAGALGRGDTQPWLIEAIAGRIDPDEGPEECARRETLEEAGLTLGSLLPVAQYFPSPGAVSEYLYSYVALADLPDGVAGVYGVEGEAEDIRGHLIGFDDLMALVASGEVANAPLILTALWLQRERPRLRA